MHNPYLSLYPYQTGMAPPASQPGNAVGLCRRFVALLMRWQYRAADRAHLADLEPHLLKDIGLTPAERDREARKPFWIA